MTSSARSFSRFARGTTPRTPRCRPLGPAFGWPSRTARPPAASLTSRSMSRGRPTYLGSGSCGLVAALGRRHRAFGILVGGRCGPDAGSPSRLRRRPRPLSGSARPRGWTAGHRARSRRWTRYSRRPCGSPGRNRRPAVPGRGTPRGRIPGAQASPGRRGRASPHHCCQFCQFWAEAQSDHSRCRLRVSSRSRRASSRVCLASSRSRLACSRSRVTGLPGRLLRVGLAAGLACWRAWRRPGSAWRSP